MCVCVCVLVLVRFTVENMRVVVVVVVAHVDGRVVLVLVGSLDHGGPELLGYEAAAIKEGNLMLGTDMRDDVRTDMGVLTFRDEGEQQVASMLVISIFERWNRGFPTIHR